MKEYNYIMKMSEVNKFLVKNKALVIIVLLVAGWFYWFQLRPSGIKKNCARESIKKAQNQLTRIYQKAYDDCIANTGWNCNSQSKDLNYQKSNNLYQTPIYENYDVRCLQEGGLK